MMSPGSSDFDYVLVGGGLGHALLLRALWHTNPAARVALVEAAPRLGGSHTWCFHVASLSLNARAFVAPLVEHEWPGYSVTFPRLQRRLQSPYAMISSARLDAVLRADFAQHTESALLLGQRAVQIGAGHVVLDNGRVLTGRLVSDARGPERLATPGAPAYQKFVGLELALAAAPQHSEPRLMDATVVQKDGFRFVYVLPLPDRRVLIEDTYYSRSPELDPVALKREILSYASQNGYRVSDVLREEQGVLPIPLAFAAPKAGTRPLCAGYAGGWFHPTTGYSLPVAARVAEAVATHAPGDALRAALERLARVHARQARFCLLLNRMLFGGFAPAAQRNVLERFYRLPEPTIERFYALALAPTDPLRILCGKPPRGLSLRRLLSSQAPA
jgi:lycopene beta-cyclase